MKLSIKIVFYTLRTNSRKAMLLFRIFLFPSKNTESPTNRGSVYVRHVKEKHQYVYLFRGKFTLSIAFSPDMKYLVSGAMDGIISIFDLESKKVRHINPEGKMGGV